MLNKGHDDEVKCFFTKMKGDYYWYMAESATKANLETIKNHALAAYEEAMLIKLPACNPVKLGLQLNFSLFYKGPMMQDIAAMGVA